MIEILSSKYDAVDYSEDRKFGVGYSFDILRAKILYSTNATKKPAYGEHGFRVIDKFSLGTNCNKDYEYEGFGVDITTLLKIMDEGKF